MTLKNKKAKTSIRKISKIQKNEELVSKHMKMQTFAKLSIRQIYRDVIHKITLKE